MKILKIIGNWLIFLAVIAGIVSLFYIQWRRPLLSDHLAELPTMTGAQVVIFALSFAFMWVEVLKWWKQIKPFNCIKCMTGWTAVILAFMFHVEFWYMYLPVGLMSGALFSVIKIRWL